VIITDVNLLLYAYDTTSPFHSKSVAWWQACLSGSDPIGLLPVVLFGFVRIGTNPRAFSNPLSCAEAIAHVNSWLRQPPVRVLLPGPNHLEEVLQLLDQLGAAGNLVTDAQIAALTIEHGAILHTADSQFVRFLGLRWFNPITGAGHASVQKPRSK
jgi:toxin-antitoxin system PIN domain toxin